ncbi:MAG TPA: 1,4-alpha-glucan branching enzyme, partial [Verrucomicrobiales bacterium]|nr:1,4-alpha-glucan branching enzyme [Verrucomicrobiales bacterium]
MIMTEDTGFSADALALLEARHSDPFGFLGMHESHGGVVVRAFHPRAQSARVTARDGSGSWEMSREHHHGLFSVTVTGHGCFPYDIEFTSYEGRVTRGADPYSFGPLLGEQDIYFFREGTHQRLWDCLGARLRVVDGIPGAQFAVWAPNA